MCRRKDFRWVRMQPLPEGLEGEMGQALAGLFSQVSGTLSCWTARESEGLLPEAA